MIIQRVIKIFFVVFGIQTLINAQNDCFAGCLNCINTSGIDSYNKCTQCQENFVLDSKNNLCIYSQCSYDLFYDPSLKNSNQGTCQAICSPLSQKSYKTNICQRQLTCSTSKTSQQNIQNDQIKDFFVYQDFYYVAVQSGYISIYDINELYLIKTMNFQAKDLNIFNINGLIFVIGNDNQLSIWDIKNEQRISKKLKNIIPYDQNTQIISMQNQLIFTYKIESQNVSFEILYDQINKTFCQSNSFIIDISGVQSVKIIDQLLFVSNSNNVNIYQIQISNSNTDFILQIQLKLECQIPFQSNNYNVLQKSSDGIFLLIQAQSIFQINTNSNTFVQIQIDAISTQQIVKARIFQGTKIYSKQLLLIQTNKQLLYYDLQTKLSKQIIQNGSSITDYEVYSLWGQFNQIIILQKNTNLVVYYVDQDSQQLIQSDQIFRFNYQAYSLKLIQYQNLNTKEQIQELIDTNLFSIQIIRQGSVEQQQQKLIQIQTIANFNLAFPTVSPQTINSNIYPHSVLKYSPSMVIYLNGQEIIFYDSSDESNCKFKRKIFFTSFVLQNPQLLTFFNDKIIARYYNNYWIIDIYKQSIIKSFADSTYLFATNNDKLVILDGQCMNVYSSDLQLLYKNCQDYFKSETFVDCYLNNDLRIILTKNPNKNNVLTFTAFQINLDNQSLSQINQLQNLNSTYQQIFINYSSQQDKANNNFFIEQIAVLDNQNNFFIYDMNLSLIYQMNQLKISQIYSIVKVLNDNQVFVLFGNQQVFIVNIQTGSYQYTQIDQLTYWNNIYDAVKKINQYGKVYYLIKFFGQDSIFEYSIDIIRNITYISGLDYLNESNNSLFLQQKTTDSIPTSINYFGGGNSGLLFSSQNYKSRYSYLFLDKSLLNSQDIYQNILQSTKIGIYFVISSKQVTSFNIVTNNFIDIIFQDPYSCDLVKGDTILICYNFSQLMLIDYSKQSQKYYYSDMFMISGYAYDLYKDQVYVYGSSFVIVNSQLQVIHTIQDEDLSGGYITNCSNSLNKVICIYQDFDSIAYLHIFDKIQQISQKINLSVQKAYTFYLTVDEQYQNIFLVNGEIKILSFNGFLQKTLGSNFYNCQVDTTKIICQSYLQVEFVFIDRVSLQATDIIIQQSSNSKFYSYKYIDFLNYILIWNMFEKSYQIQVFDLSSKQMIKNIQGFSQNQLANIKQIQFDYYSSNLLMYLDKADSTSECSILVSSSEFEFIKLQLGQIYPKQMQIQTLNGLQLINQQNLQNYIYLQSPPILIENIIQYISQLSNNQYVLSPYDSQNNILQLWSDSFQSFNQPILQLFNFNLDFQNNTNLFLNLTYNSNIKQIILQNITISIQCLGSNQIYASNIQKVIIQNIKITQLDFTGCGNTNQQSSLFQFYNISEIPTEKFKQATQKNVWDQNKKALQNKFRTPNYLAIESQQIFL
ncbi:hypothetical protein ABPG74_020352 [Tetrahymena malaccensis]